MNTSEKQERSIPITSRIDLSDLAVFDKYLLVVRNMSVKSKSELINLAVNIVANEIRATSHFPEMSNEEVIRYLMDRGLLTLKRGDRHTKKIGAMLTLSSLRAEGEDVSKTIQHKILHNKHSVQQPTVREIEEISPKTKEVVSPILPDKLSNKILIGLDGKEYLYTSSDGCYYEVMQSKTLSDDYEMGNAGITETLTDEEVAKRFEETRILREQEKKDSKIFDNIRLEIMQEKNDMIKLLGIVKPNRDQIDMCRNYQRDKLVYLNRVSKTQVFENEDQARSFIYEGISNLRSVWAEKLIKDGIMTIGNEVL